ncbi:hypothetical protein [Microbispora sp. H10836]|uniref:hypothetical protein n=1 Tax=Microbispora sp. H10836 TaxID=2729106 RepID=UPI001472E0E9|nr:hypothetical protein [Microbispora sp. H10836]
MHLPGVGRSPALQTGRGGQEPLDVDRGGAGLPQAKQSEDREGVAAGAGGELGACGEVTIRLSIVDQDDVETTTGEATVLLPTKTAPAGDPADIVGLGLPLRWATWGDRRRRPAVLALDALGR